MATPTPTPKKASHRREVPCSTFAGHNVGLLRSTGTGADTAAPGQVGWRTGLPLEAFTGLACIAGRCRGPPVSPVACTAS